MPRFASIFIFLGGLLSPPANLGDARKLFDDNLFAESVSSFNEALKNYPTKSPEIWFNIGQCWLALDSTQWALDAYGKATSRDYPTVSSYALNNAGVIAASKNQKVEEAMEAFKEALRRDPDNEFARYNYELLKKKSEQQQQEQQQDQEQEEKKDEEKKEPKDNKDKKDQQQQKPKEGQGEKAEYKDLSEEQAKMILEGMKENEKQYLQQLRRSPRTKPEQDGKPAW